MAYVGISARLVQSVLANVNRMRDKEISETLGSVSCEVRLDASELASRVVWGEHYHLIGVLPRSFLKQTSSATIRVLVPDENGADLKRSVQFSGLQNFFYRPDSESYYGVDTGTITAVAMSTLPDDMVGVAELREKVKILTERDVIMTKWRDIHSKLQTFLNACKSLNEAVKLMPNLKLYLDREDVERLETKVTRNPTTQATQAVPDDAVSAAAVAATLMGFIRS